MTRLAAVVGICAMRLQLLCCPIKTCHNTVPLTYLQCSDQVCSSGGPEAEPLNILSANADMSLRLPLPVSLFLSPSLRDSSILSPVHLTWMARQPPNPAAFGYQDN